MSASTIRYLHRAQSKIEANKLNAFNPASEGFIPWMIGGAILSVFEAAPVAVVSSYSDARAAFAERAAESTGIEWYASQAGYNLTFPAEGLTALSLFYTQGGMIGGGTALPRGLYHAAPVPGNAVGVPGSQLIHLTDEAGQAGIRSSQLIIGRHGIYAVPESVAGESTALKLARTGLTRPSRTKQFVPIPDAAASIFQRPVPIGPYSGWKYVGGVRYAPAGSISTATGAFTPSSTIVGPNLLIYGPDVLFYGGLGATGGLYWYAWQEPSQ